MTELLQFLFQGVAIGSRYALVALGFVIIYRASGVINFAQGAFVLLGAYLTYNFNVSWGLPFPVAVGLAVVGGALVGALVEVLVLRRMVGQPVFAVIMITIGLLFVLEQAVTSIWGFENLNLGDPWGIDRAEVGGVVMAMRDLWTIGIVAGVLSLFFVYFRRSAMGVSMRAVAVDQEAAMAQGISVRRVFAASWAIAGGVAALAGMSLASGSAALRPSISLFALLAFPAIILGGFDSPGGAVLGGVVIGVVQQLTAGYAPQHAPWLGDNVHLVMPYVVMILVLLVRPYGLFGTEEVQRV